MHTPAGFTPMHVTPSSLSETTLAFAFVGGKLLIRGNEQAPVVPSLDDVVREMPVGSHHYLGRLQGADCVAIGLPDEAATPVGYMLTGLRALFLRLPEATLALAARAFQVVEWDRTHRFCGRCGTPTRRQAGRARQAMPGVRLCRLSARFAGDDGAGHARPRGAARARQPFPERDVQRARGLRRAGRDDRGLHPPRSARGSRHRGQRPALLREPVVGVPALADDRVHGATTPAASFGPIRREIADARWFAVDALPDLPTTVSFRAG